MINGADTISTQVENIYSNECSKNKVSNFIVKMNDLKEISLEAHKNNNIAINEVSLRKIIFRSNI